VLANASSRGHRREDLAQAINEATFLINPHQWFGRQEFPDAIEQATQLLGAGDISTEDDYPTGVYLFDQLTSFCVEFGARKSDVEELSDLFRKAKGVK
jgi:hypothetical protein